MPIQWTTNAQKTWPAAANGIDLTPSGTGWVSGAFVTIVASTAAASVLTGVIVRTAQVADQQFEIDIAVGAAASEVVIATIKGKAVGAAFTNAFSTHRWTFAIPVDAIGAGVRVSARVRVANTAVVVWSVSLQYYEKPITGNLLVSATAVKVLPTAAAMTALTGGVAWTYGSWVQITAATAAAWVVDGLTAHLPGGDGELQLGTGGSGSEVVVGTFRVDAGNIGGFGFMALMNPLDNIGNGVRVAARCRGSAGSDAIGLAVSYREKPL